MRKQAPDSASIRITETTQDTSSSHDSSHGLVDDVHARRLWSDVRHFDNERAGAEGRLRSAEGVFRRADRAYQDSVDRFARYVKLNDLLP